jgi:hypothetical protein
MIWKTGSIRRLQVTTKSPTKPRQNEWKVDLTPEKRIFILGAGASIPYGLPSGPELKNRILSRTSNPQNSDYLKADFLPGQISEFNIAFGRSNIRSIDSFLSHKGNEYFAEIGKYAITLEIAHAEKTSELLGCVNHRGYNFNLDPQKTAVKNGWYAHLWDAMKKGPDDFEENSKLAFITFNYDRSLEEFIKICFEGSNTRAKISPQRFFEYMKMIEIIHVHGKIGNLEWQSLPESGAAATLEYEPTRGANRKLLRELSKGIKIISESTEDDLEFKRAQKLIYQNPHATLMFMGFGFHSDNVIRLGLDLRQGFAGKAESILRNQKLFATTIGLNQRKISEINQLIGSHFPFTAQTCRHLIEEHI